MVIFQKEAITFNSSVPLEKLKEHEVTCPTGVVLSLREDPLERTLTGTEVLLIFWSWATDKFTVYKNASGTCTGELPLSLRTPQVQLWSFHSQQAKGCDEGEGHTGNWLLGLVLISDTQGGVASWEEGGPLKLMCPESTDGVVVCPVGTRGPSTMPGKYTIATG